MEPGLWQNEWCRGHHGHLGVRIPKNQLHSEALKAVAALSKHEALVKEVTLCFI